MTLDEFVTIGSFFFFTGMVALLTWLITRRDDTSNSTGFFLAGRSLTFPLIAGSLLLTNLSTEQMVGLNGDAFTDGLSVMAWEVVAVVALVAMALFFLPRFLKSGIATVPQFLSLRFGKSTELICNIIFLMAYAVVLLPIVLFTGATGLAGALDLQSLTGIASDTSLLWLTVWAVGIVGSVYALFGGLRTVAVSDTLNGIGLLTGGFLIVYFGLNAVSDGAGMIEGWQTLVEAHPEKFNSIGKSDQLVPFSTLFSGILIINMFYWCTNQQIIQRTLAAKDLAEGQKGVLLTGALKLLGPMYLVLPGIIAFHLYAGDGIASKQAYGTLVYNVLPPYLTGFFAAAMVGAILSSFNSALNSTTTLFSLGIYKTVFSRQASEAQVVRSGKIFGWCIAAASMTIAPLLAGQDSIFNYLQTMNAIYFIPIFAVVLTGLLTRRVPGFAASIALIAGVLVITCGYFLPPLRDAISGLNSFHFVAIVFVTLIAFMLLMRLFAPRAQAWVQEYSGDVELTPWRGALPVGIVLLVLVITIYASFASF